MLFLVLGGMALADVLTATGFLGDSNVIVDVIGGYGALLVAVLMRYGGAQGVVFDQSTCRDGAERLVADSTVAGRCRFVGGDFFESVPQGGDVYLLKNVIHDWDDERAVSILCNCHSAMRAESRLLLIDTVLPERPGASPAHAEAVACDLNVLLLTGGSERTEPQYRSLLRATGLEVARILSPSSALQLMEARKAVSTASEPERPGLAADHEPLHPTPRA